MKTTRPDAALERLLVALENELLEVPDEEILAVAAELGMNPAMKGSAAFIGVTLLVRPMTVNYAGAGIGVTQERPSRSPRRRPKGDTPT
jgi:hypothetical protein